MQRRRGFLYVVCMYLVFYSHARAGLAAACVSCGLLCLASRKYKLLAQGMVVGVILLAGASIFSPDSISYLASSVLYKNKEEGLLASRVSPWRTAVDTIQDHPWFGTGLGTTVSGNVAIEEQSKFTSSGRVTAENGSSYLSILVGVGLIGAFPLAILLWLLTRNVLRTLIWMHQFGRVSHPAIPLAMIIAGGILHAAFEDWMFAPGNYLCVFFWSVAFVLADVTPTLPRRGVRVPWHAGMTPQPFGEVAPNP